MDPINSIVPTPPGGDSSNRAASTQFVTVAIATAIASAIASLPASVSTTQSDFISGGLAAPSNQSYNIVEFVPFPMTLTGFAGKLSSGTMTAYLSINAATVTGSTIGASSTQTTVVPTGLNTAALGSTIVLTVSSVTSAVNFSFTVQFNRALATG